MYSTDMQSWLQLLSMCCVYIIDQDLSNQLDWTKADQAESCKLLES